MLDFDTLQLRLHPAASRVKLLSEQTPASIVFFDLLCEGDRDLPGEPFESAAERTGITAHASAAPPIHLTPATRDAECRSGLVSPLRRRGSRRRHRQSRPHGTYEPDKRVMLKVKHERDCDCVVAGFRWHKKGERTADRLAAARALRRLRRAATCRRLRQLHAMQSGVELVEFLRPYRENALANHPWKISWAGDAAGRRSRHRMPGGQSRWSQGKDLSWEPLRPELVVEVAYEHMQGARFRHMAQFRRWRHDKKPSACTYDQLEVVAPQELAAIFPSGR